MSDIKELREKAKLTDDEQQIHNDRWKSHAVSQWRDEWDIEGLLKAQQDKDFSTEVSGGKPCGECNGRGKDYAVGGFDEDFADCSHCKGTGKLPGLTIQGLVELYRIMLEVYGQEEIMRFIEQDGETIFPINQEVKASGEGQ